MQKFSKWVYILYTYRYKSKKSSSGMTTIIYVYILCKIISCSVVVTSMVSSTMIAHAGLAWTFVISLCRTVLPVKNSRLKYSFGTIIWSHLLVKHLSIKKNFDKIWKKQARNFLLIYYKCTRNVLWITNLVLQSNHFWWLHSAYLHCQVTVAYLYPHQEPQQVHHVRVFDECNFLLEYKKHCTHGNLKGAAANSQCLKYSNHTHLSL